MNKGILDAVRVKWQDQENRQAKTPPIMTGIPRVQLRIRGRRASIDSSNTIERISRTIRTNRHTSLGNQSPIHVSNALSIVHQTRFGSSKFLPKTSQRTDVNAIHPFPPALATILPTSAILNFTSID